MAAAIPPVFDNDSALRRPFPRAPSRLAVALTLSAFVHLWLAAGVAVDVPEGRTPRGPAAIAARLELSAIPPEVRLPPPAATVTEKNARQDSRDGGQPTPDGASRPSAISPSPEPSSAAEVPEPRVSGPALPQIPDPAYYPARQLDVYPALLQPVRLEYPERALQNKAGGRVLVMLFIDETGGVNDLSVVEAEPAGYFEHAVRAAFTDARFSPARKDGRTVKSRVLIRVNYNPGEAEGAIR